MAVSSLRELWRYRGFIRASVQREVQLKYKDSVLGLWWLIGSPLVMILIYTLVFSRIMHSRLPGMDMAYAYSVYLCAGLLQWNLFAEIVGRTQSFVVDNANLIKKASFPVISLPVIATAGSVINFSIIYGIFILFMLIQGILNINILIIYPMILVILILMAFSFGVLMAVYNVFLRDIGQIIPLLLQILFWATPVVYPSSILPENIKELISWVPLYNLMDLSHQIHLGLKPDLTLLLYPLTISIVLLLITCLSYRRLYGDILDEI